MFNYQTIRMSTLAARAIWIESQCNQRWLKLVWDETVEDGHLVLPMVYCRTSIRNFMQNLIWINGSRSFFKMFFGNCKDGWTHDAWMTWNYQVPCGPFSAKVLLNPRSVTWDSLRELLVFQTIPTSGFSTFRIYSQTSKQLTNPNIQTYKKVDLKRSSS